MAQVQTRLAWTQSRLKGVVSINNNKYYKFTWYDNGVRVTEVFIRYDQWVEFLEAYYDGEVDVDAFYDGCAMTAREFTKFAR